MNKDKVIDILKQLSPTSIVKPSVEDAIKALEIAEKIILCDSKYTHLGKIYAYVNENLRIIQLQQERNLYELELKQTQLKLLKDLKKFLDTLREQDDIELDRCIKMETLKLPGTHVYDNSKCWINTKEENIIALAKYFYSLGQMS